MDIKWIKIVTDIFDDEKILLIESLPDADSIIVIWFKLLCLAGKQNNSGVFTLNGKIPYTDKMLSTIFRRKETTLQLSLKTFEQFGMIEIIDDVITIPNWDKHQNIDKLEQIREQTRLRVRNFKLKQKLLTSSNVTLTLPVTQGNATDKTRLDKTRLDKSREEKNSTKDSSVEQERLDVFNETIKYLNVRAGTKYSFKTAATQKHLNARLDDGYSIDDFKTVIDKKCVEWMGTERERFLRPETLFRPANFESYINQKMQSKENVFKKMLREESNDETGNN